MRSEHYTKTAGNRSVLDICLDVHMCTTGAYPRHKQEQEDDIDCLEEVLENWTDSIHAPKFDNAVRKLIQVTLDEYFDEKITSGSVWSSWLNWISSL
jgi:hypothetical protein